MIKQEKKEIPKYNPDVIESKWQAIWQKKKTYQPDLDNAKKPFYNLMMFPYPSAEGMHVGNMYAFTGSDVYGRFKRMQGFDVFEPIGLDGFGIHSENYALKVGKHPKEQAKISQENFYRQLHAIGNGFAWDNKVETYDPDYYKWTQWIFIQLFKAGLAYRKKASVNFCPSCKTVLADEQVIAGKCERCGTEVVKKDLEQWFFRITDYAERLLNNIDGLDWTEKVKIAQREWIGKSEGAEIEFRIKNSELGIKVFTTRPDTLYGATFMVLSPEHPIVAQLINSIPTRSGQNSKLEELKEYIKIAQSKTDQERIAEGREKTGVDTGLIAINPVNNEEIPIWIADYVLGGYGTGAIMAVPAHDQRDFEFAKKFKLPIHPVILPQRECVDQDEQLRFQNLAKVHRGFLKKFAQTAKENKKKLIVWGGWAIALQVGKEFRENEDLDFFILEQDIEWWKSYIKSLELNISHNVSNGKENPYYFTAKGKDIWIDFVVIKVDEKNNVFWSGSKKEAFPGSFNEVFEEKVLDEALVLILSNEASYKYKKDHILNGKPLRWKDQADFLMMRIEPYMGKGILVNSQDWNGWQMPGSISKVIDWIEEKKIGKRQIQYHLRDWLISRQRYWGPPIPMIDCPKCGWQPVPEKDLPVLLPDVKDWKPMGAGKSPLATIEDFVKTTCSKCGGEAKRETDVSDTFLDSAWYFFRYITTDFKNIPFPSETFYDGAEVASENFRVHNAGELGLENKKSSVANAHSENFESSPRDISNRTEKWLPVNMYIGGAEHSVLHLLYSRFITMVFKDLKLIDFEEPYSKFRAHGLLIKEGSKMSKSKGNVVIPDQYIKKFGADTLRLYLMFLGPFTQGGDFYDTGIEGMYKFIKRIWTLVHSTDFSDKTTSEGLRAMNKIIKKVTEDVEALRYNTAIASMMEYYNFLSKEHTISKEQIKTLILLILPFAPHICEELWELLGDKNSVHLIEWPSFSEELLIEKNATIVIQINGKIRDVFQVDTTDIDDKQMIETTAKESQKVKKCLDNKQIDKVIYIKGKVINFVIGK